MQCNVLRHNIYFQHETFVQHRSMNGRLDLISCLLRNLGHQFFAPFFSHLNPSATCSNDKMSALGPHYI
jgi:hypothetical protein